MSRRLLGGLALGLVVAALGAYGGAAVVRVSQLQREIDGLERDIGALRARTEALGQTIERLRHDPAYVEQLAREELGMVREGETVLKFPSPPR